MNLPTLVRNTTAIISSSIPSFHGLGTLCSIINSGTLRMGADPLAKARMKDGSTFLVNLTTNTEKWAFYFGIYDKELIETIHTILDLDSCFLDVGANIGFYTVSVSSLYRDKCGKGTVVSFEPLASNYKRLEQNVKQNDLQDYCLLRNVGLSDQSRQCDITLREDFSAGSETGNAAIPTNEELDKGFKRVPISLETLDSLFASQDFSKLSIDLIKVDIEGHEDYFLRGASATIASQRPTLLLEINKPYYRAREVELDSTFLPLIPQNYSLFRYHKNRWVRFSSLEECKNLDNVLLIPNDKLDQPRFREILVSTSDELNAK